MLATGENEGLPFMAQQFIDGLSLDDKLKRDGPLDVEGAVHVCADVAAGLEALWAAGMVHRDVKPANILLDASGRGYITDFGLAKDTQGSFLTLPGQALGSMDYMAPEQIRGEPVTAATDIYALGCVMYECSAASRRSPRRQGMRMLWAHLQDEPPDPRRARPTAGEFVRALLLRAGEGSGKRPAERGRVRRMLAARG